jgi:hypothetical protein
VSFLTPAAFFLTALLPVIIAMYLLKLRRQERQVSSIYLWRHVVRDLEANAPWQRLRFNLLMLLQLAFLTALILALARPFTKQPGFVGGAAILIIDNSASMGANDELPSRLKAAKLHAHQLLDGLPAETQFTLIAAGERPDLLLSSSLDRVAAHQSIDSIQLNPTSSDLGSALQLASAITSRQPDSRITVLSDGGANLPKQTALNAQLEYIPLGKSAQNQALGLLNLSPAPGGESLTAFAQVINYGTESVKRRLAVYTDGDLFNAYDLELAPGGEQSVIAQGISPEIETIEARLLPDEFGTDYLASDDYAIAVNRTGEPIQITLISPGNRFLETALNLMPSVETQTIPPGSDLPNTNDLVILDAGVQLTDTNTSRNLLFIAPTQSTDFFTVTGTITNPTPIAVDVNDPLLSYVTLDGVSILDTLQIVTPLWAQPVIVAYDPTSQPQDSSPLLYKGQINGQRVGVLAFDLRRSDLPLQIAFPILLSNLVDWFTPGSGVNIPTQLSPGQVLTLNTPMDAPHTAAVIQRPDGNRSRIEPTDGRIIFNDTKQLGLYQIMWEDNPEEILAFSVNLYSPQESAIQPRPSLEISSVISNTAEQEQTTGRREWWRWAALAALCLLVIEYLIYKRSSLNLLLERIGLINRQGWSVPGKRTL